MNAIVEKFVGELARARQPYFTNDTQVVCGRVVLTAMPDLNAATVTTFRLQFPVDYQSVVETTLPFMFIVCAFDAETLCQLQPKIGPAMRAGKTLSINVKGKTFRTLRDGDNWMIEVHAEGQANQ